MQHFAQHTVSMTSPTASESQDYDHVLARVCWKQKHTSEDLYGVSATVCFDCFEASNACAFIPVQRIYCRCAPATFPIEIGPVTEWLVHYLSNILYEHIHNGYNTNSSSQGEH